MTRYFQILVCENMPSNLPANTLIINEFSKIQNLLGQEFETILFDARKGIHLEAFAIAAGTLKMNGTLIVLLSNWEKLHSQIDEDSLRWSGSLESITTPRFMTYFKHCIHKYGFPVLYHQNDLKFDRTFQQSFINHNATLDQQKIIEQILQKESDLYFLTAKRGRGKSALAGLLANQLDTKIYLTAPNKSAVKILSEFSQKEIIFIAPDELFLALQCCRLLNLPLSPIILSIFYLRRPSIVMREQDEALRLNLSKKLTALFQTLSLLNRYAGLKMML